MVNLQSNLPHNLPLNLPSFETLEVYTRTYAVAMNISINIAELFSILQPECPLSDDGTYIATIISKKEAKGFINAVLRKKLDMIATGEYTKDLCFRNSITVELMLPDKYINMKVYTNGVLQLTGARTEEHIKQCVRTLWNCIKNYSSVYTFLREYESLVAILVPAVLNISIDLGFPLDREKFTDYIRLNTEYFTLLETFGYSGLNIKMLLGSPVIDVDINVLTIHNDMSETMSTMKYGDYLDLLPRKDRVKKLKKKRYSTILVFRGGAVLVSAMTIQYAQECYEKFITMVEEGYEHIIECIE
jgi:TATA-box binding protein (TBP) (component of TFIID and TFIIIB)